MQNQAPPYNSIKFYFIWIFCAHFKLNQHKFIYINAFKYQMKHLYIENILHFMNKMSTKIIFGANVPTAWIFMRHFYQIWALFAFMNVYGSNCHSTADWYQRANYQFMCSLHIMVCVCFSILPSIFPHFSSFSIISKPSI